VLLREPALPQVGGRERARARPAAGSTAQPVRLWRGCGRKWWQHSKAVMF